MELVSWVGGVTTPVRDGGRLRKIPIGWWLGAMFMRYIVNEQLGETQQNFHNDLHSLPGCGVTDSDRFKLVLEVTRRRNKQPLRVSRDANREILELILIPVIRDNSITRNRYTMLTRDYRMPHSYY